MPSLLQGAVWAFPAPHSPRDHLGSSGQQSVFPLPGEEAAGRGPNWGAGRAGVLRVQAEEVPPSAKDLFL